MNGNLLAILLENGIGLEEALSLSFRNSDEVMAILNNGGNISEVKGIDKNFCYYLRFFSSVASMEKRSLPPCVYMNCAAQSFL